MSTFEDIDLNYLRILATLLETENVTRAARQLGMSQPTVSRALAALRKSFGDPLLVKTNAGMTPTQRAVALREPLSQWLAATLAVLRSQDVMPGTAIAGHVRIASTDYGVLSVLEPAMPTILAQAPDLFLDVIALGPENLNQLSSGAVDMVVSGWDPEPGRAHERHLFEEICCCMFRKGHPLEQAGIQTRLTPDELADWPHVVLSVHGADMDPLAPYLRDASRPRKVAARMPYLASAAAMLQTTDAVFVGPVRALRRLATAFGLTARPIPPELGRFDNWLYWHERSRRDPVVMWLVDTLTRTAARSRDAALPPGG